MHLKVIRVKYKILLSFLLILTMVIIYSVITAIKINSLNESFREVIDGNTQKIIVAYDIRGDLANTYTALISILVSTDASNMDIQKK